MSLFLFSSPPTGWVQQGGAAVTFQNGDQLGARATADGLVRVYRNGTLVASVVIDSAWAYRASGGELESEPTPLQRACLIPLVAAVYQLVVCPLVASPTATTACCA